MINVNKFERLRRSFKVIHLRLHSRHRLIHLFIHLLFSLVLILSFNGGLSHHPAKQQLGSSGSCLLYLCFFFVFIKKKNCGLCVISHPCLPYLNSHISTATTCLQETCRRQPLLSKAATQKNRFSDFLLCKPECSK